MAGVVIKMIPKTLSGFFKDALKAGAIGVAVEEGKGLIVKVYKHIEGPLGNYLKNPPKVTQQVGIDAIKLANETLNEIENARRLYGSTPQSVGNTLQMMKGVIFG